MRVKSSWSKMTKLQKQIKNLNKKVMRRASKIVLQAARSTVPVASGALRQSLSAKVDSFKGEVTSYSVIGPRSKFLKAVGSEVKMPSMYAHFIEKGKFARPFLAPALAATQAAFVAEVQRLTAEEIKGVIGE